MTSHACVLRLLLSIHVIRLAIHDSVANQPELLLCTCPWLTRKHKYLTDQKRLVWIHAQIELTIDNRVSEQVTFLQWPDSSTVLLLCS
jgi:hypothetical protein